MALEYDVDFNKEKRILLDNASLLRLQVVKASLGLLDYSATVDFLCRLLEFGTREEAIVEYLALCLERLDLPVENTSTGLRLGRLSFSDSYLVAVVEKVGLSETLRVIKERYLKGD